MIFGYGFTDLRIYPPPSSPPADRPPDTEPRIKLPYRRFAGRQAIETPPQAPKQQKKKRLTQPASTWVPIKHGSLPPEAHAMADPSLWARSIGESTPAAPFASALHEKSTMLGLSILYRRAQRYTPTRAALRPLRGSAGPFVLRTG